MMIFFYFQTEIAKRLNAICAQVIPFLSQEVRDNIVKPVLSDHPCDMKIAIDRWLLIAE